MSLIVLLSFLLSIQLFFPFILTIFVLTQMDVSGYCSTGYTILPTEDNSTLILRQKDLRTCRERGRLISSLQTTPYHSASKVQSPPLLE